jgi:hypothetical protein
LIAARKVGLKETIACVGPFLKTLLKAVMVSDAFPFMLDSHLPVTPSPTDGNTDLVISCCLRSFPSSLAASVFAYVAPNNRPLHDCVIVNAAYIPGSAQSVASTGGREFSEGLLPDVFHAAGICPRPFDTWINSSIRALYLKVLVGHPRKMFQSLTNSKINEVLSRRWGTECFDREQ